MRTSVTYMQALDLPAGPGVDEPPLLHAQEIAQELARRAVAVARPGHDPLATGGEDAALPEPPQLEPVPRHRLVEGPREERGQVPLGRGRQEALHLGLRGRIRAAVLSE